MSLNESIIYILIQELFENDILNIDGLAEKYNLNKKQIKKINTIYNILYCED